MLVDLDQLIVSRLLIQANSGGGKSRAIRYLCEQTQGKVQQIILDHEGEFSTLREKYSYLLVGKDGEIPVPSDARGAKLLARKLFELGVSTVVDLSDMSLERKRDFVKAFIGAINNLPRALWKDCLIIIDEVHNYAPESGKGRSAALEEISTLQSSGRKRGFCGIFATQRLAKLNKDVSAECLNKLIGRTSNEDLERSGKELGFKGDDARALLSLHPGTFWTYGPAIGPNPVQVRTGDVATHPPKRGVARAPDPTPKAIAKIMAALADLPKQAADEEKTVDELRRQVSDQQRQIRQLEKGAPKVEPDQTAIARSIERAVKIAKTEQSVTINNLRKALDAAMRFIINVSTHNFDVAGVDQAELQKAIEAAVGRATGLIDRRLVARGLEIEQLKKSAASISAKLRALLEVDGQDVSINVDVVKNEPFTVTSPARSPRTSTPAPARELVVGEGLTGPKQKILNAIAELQALGVEQPTLVQVAVWVGLSHTTGSYQQNIRELAGAGYLERGPGVVWPTAEGLQAAAPVDTPPDVGAMQERWLSKLPNPQARALQTVVERYPLSIERAELAAALNLSPTTGSYQQNLRVLRDYGLLEFKDGAVRATSMIAG